MVSIWKQENVCWRIGLCSGGEAFTLRMGDGPRELLAELRYLGVTQEELTALLKEEPSGGVPAGGRKEGTR